MNENEIDSQHRGFHTENIMMKSAAPERLSPVEQWDRDSARRALDDLFTNARQFNSSSAYFELMQFIGRFRFYSPFNAMLIYTQMPGARFVATAYRWGRDFRRRIKTGAHPLLILQPMGPVLFVFDVIETEPLPNAPALPSSVTNPFNVRGGRIDIELDKTVQNAKRDGIQVCERAHGSQRAGSIQESPPGAYVEVLLATKPTPKSQRIPLLYELLLNSNHSPEARYATLVHELGHLYCGHLGTPNAKWWPDRQGLPYSIREFEAESVCYLVCTRLGIDNPSAEYLASYLKNYDSTPPISLDAVLKSSWLIERMGQEWLGLRKGTEE